MEHNKKTRRNGVVVMAQLIMLLGSLWVIILPAVINGALGFISAMGVTVSGAAAVVKAMGENIPFSYTALMAAAVISGVVRGLLRFFEQYSNHYIAFRLLAVLRDKIFARLRLLAPAKLETKQKGAIISMITSDIETLEVFYAHTISPVCIALTVTSLVLIFVTKVAGVQLAVVALAAYIFIGVVIPYFASSGLRESGVAYRRQLSSFNAYFLDSIKGIKDIVFNNGDKERSRRVNEKSRQLLEHTKIMKETSAKAAAVTELSVSLAILMTLAAGLFMVAEGKITIGSMVVGVVAVFSSFGPVVAIAALPQNLTQTFASGDRVLDLLKEVPSVTAVEKGQDFTFENLRVNNLSFGYSRHKTVLKDVMLKARKGEIIGISGPSGCGKSTFLKLLLRFWQKSRGEINYNGTDVENINSKSLMENVTMVSQTTYLFDDTIEENLRIAKKDATQREIEQACKAAAVHDFIMQLPLGYKTKAGAMGENFSAGEKQRIGLARAFLSGSDVILLDEPTSNVDSINEGIILKALKEHKSDKCIILVSHRQSTMSIADRIYKIKEGRMCTA